MDSGLAASRRPGMTAERYLSAARRKQRRRDEALPDRAAVELNGHAVGREDRAGLPIVGPDVAGIVDPGARRLAGLVEQAQLPAVLGDEGRLLVQPGITQLHANILPGEIDLRRRRCGRRRQYRQRTPNGFHRSLSSALTENTSAHVSACCGN